MEMRLLLESLAVDGPALTRDVIAGGNLRIDETGGRHKLGQRIGDQITKLGTSASPSGR